MVFPRLSRRLPVRCRVAMTFVQFEAVRPVKKVQSEELEEEGEPKQAHLGLEVAAVVVEVVVEGAPS